MGQISAKFVIKAVECLPPPPLSPPPARTHLPPPWPHSPLYSAITAGLSAATLTNESMKTVCIQVYRNISLPCCAAETTARQRRCHYNRCRLTFVSILLVQVVLTSRMAHVTSSTSKICARVRGMCTDGVDACVLALETVRLINCCGNLIGPEQPITLRFASAARHTTLRRIEGHGTRTRKFSLMLTGRALPQQAVTPH